ncbi:MAG: translation initiation factor IF-2 N-terminal domain-containing protein, partial [Oscillospiraceae bacterium]|nr:translation initiation factor IF-2 N-terminal domain-containing protein [Oscillospiraceae bacterium]
MSFVKYRVKEVATDFGITPKEVSEIIGKYYEKPKSYSQVLTADELNAVFDHVTKHNQISSLAVVFDVKPAQQQPEAPKAEAPKAEAAKQPAKPQQGASRPAQQPGNKPQQGANRPAQQPAGKPQQNNARPAQPQQQAQPVKQPEPERKRERRVVDTSAVQVNTSRFDDVDNLVSERVQDYQGGKQRIGGGKGKQQKQQQMNAKKGNKARNEEQEKMRRLQMEVARKAPTVVKIPDEITVSELASRMKKTVAEVIKTLMKNGVLAAMNQVIDFDTAEFVATEMGC